MRIGQGIDIHRFSEDPHRRLVLGGVEIEGARGLGGHSDADAVCHALADAVLGAVGLGDLGRHFPDTDPVWEGADSVALLTEVVRMAAEQGYALRQRGLHDHRRRAAPGAAHRRHGGAAERRCSGAPVSVKATRAEGLGALGRAEGIACLAVVLMEPREPESRPPHGAGRASAGAGGATAARGAAGPRPEALQRARRRPGRGPPGRARAAVGRAPHGAPDHAGRGPGPLAAAGPHRGAGGPPAGPGRDRAPGPARRPGPHRGAPGRAGPGPAARARRRSRTCAAPDRHGTAPFLLVAAGITDPRNLGALLRSAECAGVTGVVLPRHRSARLSPTVAKTAAGAIEHLPFAVVGGVPAALSELRDLGVWSIGLAGEADAVALRPAARRGSGGAGGRQRGEGTGAAGAPALRCGGRHPPARHAAVAQRRRGRRGGLLRGGPPARRRARAPARARPPPPPPRCRTRSGAPPPGCRSGTPGTRRVSGLGSSLGSRLSRRISAVSGTTTAKKTTVATMRNDSTALRNDPYLNVRVVAA